ncbi:MAG: NAD-dependent DNA ligase LigA [Bacteroidales bacterium]|nr:NAD-dependent DNA ligase LigA [Bacteroidales bacterium]
MDKNEAKARIEELRALLWENSRRYYVENMPTMSDFDYDHLMRELEDLENEWPEFYSPDSPTQRVGSDLEDGPAAQQGFVQREHRYPMLSLSNTYSRQEIEEFAARAAGLLEGREFSFCCELKFDGTSICLTYKDGKLARALTRGDGRVGDDVTENVMRIANIPHELKGDYPDEFEIRGEILMPYSSFDHLNQQRLDAEDQPFANPRNAASGSLKLQDPDEVARRGLYCTLYHIPAQSLADDSLSSTHSGLLQKAASWGLPVSEYNKVCHGIEEVLEYIDYWDTERKKLPYATDGIVIKIDQLDYQRELGYTAKSPRWAVAYKFKAEQALAKVLSIDYQVGRTGAVTPVANLSPVLLSGTIVKRATLNNADQMAILDIRIGDMVYVEKGGEIIPKITAVELSQRPADSQPVDFPLECPDCHTPLRRGEGEAKWFCPNTDGCPMQIKGRLLHFMSRKAMNIIAGEATVDQLYNLGLAHTPADLYDLKASQLMTLEGWKEKSAKRFIDSLRESVKVPFERVLFALGIRYVGEQTAREVARHFGDIDAIAAASEEELAAVKDVGDVIAGSIFEYMSDARHAIEIQRLRGYGLKFAVDGGAQSVLSDSLKDLTIVVSGNFSCSRETLKDLIVRHGGRNSASVSAKTSFLLAGIKPGPEKVKKCQELGIRIVSEDEFWEMLPEGSRIDSSDESEPTLF